MIKRIDDVRWSYCRNCSYLWKPVGRHFKTNTAYPKLKYLPRQIPCPACTSDLQNMKWLRQCTQRRVAKLRHSASNSMDSLLDMDGLDIT